MQIYFLQEEFILKRNHTNARYAGRHFLAKEEQKYSTVSVKTLLHQKITWNNIKKQTRKNFFRSFFMLDSTNVCLQNHNQHFENKHEKTRKNFFLLRSQWNLKEKFVLLSFFLYVCVTASFKNFPENWFKKVFSCLFFYVFSCYFLV